MKGIYICLISSIVIFSGCKKSGNPNSTGNSSSSNGGQNGGIYGYLRAIRGYNVFNGTLYLNSNSALAYFFNLPNQLSSQTKAGDVYIASTKLKYDAASKTYLDTTYQIQINPTMWQVTGGNSIPSFTYTNNDSLPGYIGYTLLPDSIDKALGLNLQINGVSGANSIEIIISDGTSASPPHEFTQLLSNVSANNSVTITSSNLIGMNSVSNGELTIVFQKVNDQVISGKTFRFISEKQIYKYVKVK